MKNIQINNIDWLNRYWWLGFILLIIGEFILFRNFVYREMVPYIPMAFDQAGYLSVAYGLYEIAKSQGIWAAIVSAMTFPSGPLFMLQSLLFFLLTGASRFSALSINFIYFAALQWVTFLTVRYLFKKTDMAIMAVGILLATKVPFYVGGGISDFRMDFIAFCLYGIFIAAVLRSNIFLNTKWSF